MPKESQTLETKKLISSTLPSLVDADAAIEKERIRLQVRESHLKLQGRIDPETSALVEKLLEWESYIDGRVAALQCWFSLIAWLAPLTWCFSGTVARSLSMDYSSVLAPPFFETISQEIVSVSLR